MDQTAHMAGVSAPGSVPETPRLVSRVGWGLIGPLLAVMVTWLPPIMATRFDPVAPPTQREMEELRATPSDAVLAEIRSRGVAAQGLEGLAAPVIVRIAEGVLLGRLELPGQSYPVDVPFDPDGDVLGTTSRHFQLCSLIVPSVLARAYSVSGETRFLEAAVQYVLDWSRFEAALWLPRGYVFNDHRIAARAIVVTEIWRLYRSSGVFEPGVAIELLQYVQRLAGLLRKPELYTYWTNHGLMQSLSLLHLAVAFPLLPDAALNARIGSERILGQFPYYINEEGVVLENSAGYQKTGLQILAAGQSYLALLGKPMPTDMMDRMQRGLRFNAALRRPDGTLPPIGDTHDDPSGPPAVAATGRGSPLVVPEDPITMAPAAGVAVLWRNLERWPDVTELSQAVMTWGNFPTKTHKHADDLGLSLWAGGVQWVRSVGYLPYDDEGIRESAIGWRSSNAPHWVGEDPAIERSASLLSSVRAGQEAYLDVSRPGAAGSGIRRQLLQFGEGAWLSIDSFESPAPREAEIIWRFSPAISLRPLGSAGYLLEKAGAPVAMAVHFDGSAAWKAEADASGTATWNSGVFSAGRVTQSPAIRLTASGTEPVLLTVFELRESVVAEGDVTAAASLEWSAPERWAVSIKGSQAGEKILSRSDGRLSLAGSDLKPESWASSSELGQAATVRADLAARAALQDATRRYGTRFEPMLERRAKVSAVVVACGLIQIVLFVMARRRAWWQLLFATSTVSWIALAAFLHLDFLAGVAT